MSTFQSVLQNVSQLLKSWMAGATKKMCHMTAVFMTGVTVITAITFTSSAYGGGERDALAALVEQPSETGYLTGDTPVAASVIDTQGEIVKAGLQAEITESIKGGQLLAGTFLEQEALSGQSAQPPINEDIEKIKNEILSDAREGAARQAAAKGTPVISYTQEDYQTLLKIVEAEAGISDSKGKILVANVIINRVKSGQFPDTVTGVVYQRSQFSPVSNGSINRVKVTQETVDSVDRALKGEDYSQGALYFMYRKGSHSRAVRWFDSHLTYLFQHGNHEFFR